MMKNLFQIVLMMVLVWALVVSVSAQGNPDPPPAPSPSTLPATTPPSPLPTAAPREERSAEFYSGEFLSEDDEQSVLEPGLYTKEGITKVLLPRIANTVAGFLAAIGVVFLIVSGIQFLMSQGEPENITKAAKSAFYVVIGLVLLMFAYAMVYLFLTLLGSP